MPSSPSPTSEEGAQTATALQVIATAENQLSHGKAFDLRDHDDGGQRDWSAKVADPDGRQFNLTITYDGSSVISTGWPPAATTRLD
ncbi:MAG TPA: hypothetical protein VFY56_00620 [Propionibacteriaceae bacterium]|nr:hypothetical protein [Propionibacteriaceae bacterium]